MHNQGTIPTPNIYRVWREKSSTKFYVKLDGRSIGKVEIDWGAWGEYSDNPDDVKDRKHIILKVKKFASRAFVLHVENGLRLNLTTVEEESKTREKRRKW